MSKELCAGGATLNLLQITDCHLTKDADSDLLGVVTRDSLAAVIELIEDNIKHKIHASPDFIVASGDIAQDASAEAYCYFQTQIAPLCSSSGWFSGNHDDTEVLAQTLQGAPELARVYRFDHWQLILLDSSVRGKVHGWLEPSELHLLEKSLAERPDLHSLVCLHHHPVDINCAWLDKIGLHNRDAFFEVLDRFDNVRGVLWGHIHQEWNSLRNGLPLMATPSTCIQFLPESDGFAVDNIAPGYRWLSLQADGRIDTQVYRAEQFEFDLDLKSTGY
jgi:Icc protein